MLLRGKYTLENGNPPTRKQFYVQSNYMDTMLQLFLLILLCVQIILVRSGCCVATFWEIAAHSVDYMFSLYFDYL